MRGVQKSAPHLKYGQTLWSKVIDYDSDENIAAQSVVRFLLAINGHMVT